MTRLFLLRDEEKMNGVLSTIGENLMIFVMYYIPAKCEVITQGQSEAKLNLGIKEIDGIDHW